MYKSKLQEICHQKLWNLPEYSVTKQGQDHNPSFYATCVVNGQSFVSESPATTSKLAQNDAARLAFLHFSSQPRPPHAAAAINSRTASASASTVTVTNSNLANNAANNHNNVGSGPGAAADVSPVNGGFLNVGASSAINSSVVTNTHLVNNAANNISNNNNVGSGVQISNNPITSADRNGDVSTDVQHMYKSILQTYAQKRGVTIPTYSCIREGPPHVARFKSKVTVGDRTYESLEFFPILNKAEQDAARVALISLAPDVVHDESPYKNLLQELAMKEKYSVPAYSTVTHGESHKPTFVSTVEVEGQSFTGQECRTKKQAELNAAKIAYRALKQRKLATSVPENTSQSPKASSLNTRARTTEYLGEPSQSAQSMSPPHQRQKVVQCSSSSSRSNYTAYLRQNVQPITPGCNSQAEDDTVAEVSSALPPKSPNDNCLDLSLPLVPIPADFSGSPQNSSTQHEAAASTLDHNKVIVHSRETNVIYPPGSTVLPMSDDNWVAVRTPQSSQ